MKNYTQGEVDGMLDKLLSPELEVLIKNNQDIRVRLHDTQWKKDGLGELPGELSLLAQKALAIDAILKLDPDIEREILIKNGSYSAKIKFSISHGLYETRIYSGDNSVGTRPFLFLKLSSATSFANEWLEEIKDRNYEIVLPCK